MVKTIWFLILLSVFVRVYPLTAPETIKKETSSDAETTFSSHYLSNLDHKIENMIKTLSAVDTSIKQLQEKAHTWAIFHHHIDSWNDQMKTIEHKIDLIKRTQDENQIVNQKLISQEFTLNHILSKLVYLSDSYSRGENENIILRNGENGLAEIKKLINGDRKMRNEIGTRLSNILRHVQNIERDNCRSGSKSSVNNNELKMAKLINPIMSCNGSKSNGKIDLKDIDRKLGQLIEIIPQNVTQKIIDNDQKNTERWLLTAQYFEKFDERAIQMKEVNAENYLLLSNLLQSMSSEITTFTGSSDLLLKKFEKLVMDVQKKVDKLGEREELEEKNISEGSEPTKDKTDERNDISNGSQENFDIDVETDNRSKNTTEDVEEIDNNSKELEEPQEEINFVHPSKNGCHELTKRVDGIYKFSTQKTNTALRDMNEQYCAFSTDGPAWTVIQNRGPYVVQENFNRSWNEYRDGFGSLEKDFWMGNEFLHQLTYSDNYELRIELEDFEGIKAWVEYSTFRINAERYYYNLIIDGYRGAIPDALNYHNQHDFSTYDSRNDKTVDACCACATGYASGTHHSGWWFNNCAEANLNGVFHDTPLGHNYIGIVWDQWHGDYSLRSSKMMLRPKVWPKEREEEPYNGSSEDP